MSRLAALTLGLLLLPLAAGAETQADAARVLAQHRQALAAARAHERADTARAALLAEQQVQAAAALRKLEDQTSADAEQLAALQQAQLAAAQRLQAAQLALERLLPAMQRLAAAPAATLLAAPQPPADAVRGIAIMQGIAAGIEAEAKAVQTQSAGVAALLAQTQAAEQKLAAAAAAQQAAEISLSAAIDSAKTSEMADADVAAQEAAASLAAQHRLDSIAAAVARLVPSGGSQANLPAGTGGAPVAGRITQAYGSNTLAGPAAGVSYSAAPGARVISPCAGTVMFAGAFPAYGLMVIADCGDGTSVVLAGMHHLDVAAGERLAHGQPVGTMLGYDAANPARQPVLYVELRQNGATVDPTAWLARPER